MNLLLFLKFIILFYSINIINLFNKNEMKRPPSVSGIFYPKDSIQLKQKLDLYLELKKPYKINDEIIALIAPHAGYDYSGWVAGKSYRELYGKKYDVAIIIAPNHLKYFKGASVFEGESYCTPLGEIKVDNALRKLITEKQSLVKLSNEGHEWNQERSEHSLEVQLPFLQIVQPNISILPIIMGSQDDETVFALIKAIVPAIRKSEKKVLLIASSDLSHYHNYSSAKKLDEKFINTFEAFDYFKLSTNCFSGQWEACGAGPVIAVMQIAEQLGGTESNIMQIANSAESPYIKADTNKVVGYFSGLITNKNENKSLLPNLNANEKIKLLDIAKNTINNTVNNQELIKFEEDSKNLNQIYASFVTIRKNHELRGCIGSTISEFPLYKSVINSAKLSSIKDSRFKPVSQVELNEIKIDITILSRLKRIIDYNEIKLGIDGVYIRNSEKTALFLPQVANEQNWDLKLLLQNICIKAGLPKTAYTYNDTEFFIFQGLNIK